ncbi:MAG: hypothetical protein D6800_10160 [Candidatus Zixiibacteriota bacterium]|nr:MAG: hypothetical protein D6800_10160 [candidate division Zixibacteria bacterium]
MQIQDGANSYHVIAPAGMTLDHVYRMKNADVFFIGDAYGNRNKKVIIRSFVIIPTSHISTDTMRLLSTQLIERAMI